MTVLVTAVALVGCDAVTSHSAIPADAQQLMRDGINATRSLRPDVEQFVAGFNFVGDERHAVAQMTNAMLMVLEITDAGSFVRAAVEIKRSQACLAAVGIEGSGLIEQLQQAIYRDERATRLWGDMMDYVNSLELPEMNGLVCDHRGGGIHAVR